MFALTEYWSSSGALEAMRLMAAAVTSLPFASKNWKHCSFSGAWNLRRGQLGIERERERERERESERAGEGPAHVLDNAKHAHVRLLAEVDLFPHVLHGDFLGCRHDDGAVDAGATQVLMKETERVYLLLCLRVCVHWGKRVKGASRVDLYDGQVLVGCAWRRVDDEIVECAPVHVREKLFDEAVLPRPSPDDRVVLVRQHESDLTDRMFALFCFI
jgi:hypothetical protein